MFYDVAAPQTLLTGQCSERYVELFVLEHFGSRRTMNEKARNEARNNSLCESTCHSLRSYDLFPSFPNRGPCTNCFRVSRS